MLVLHTMKKSRTSRLFLDKLKARVPERKASRQAGWINTGIISGRSVLSSNLIIRRDILSTVLVCYLKINIENTKSLPYGTKEEKKWC